MKFDEDGEFGRCPYCKDDVDEHENPKGLLFSLEDWSGLHSRETLLHCWDCDRKYIVRYKLVSVVELIEKEIKVWNIELN